MSNNTTAIPNMNAKQSVLILSTKLQIFRQHASWGNSFCIHKKVRDQTENVKKLFHSPRAQPTADHGK